jgi:hypothetical protein
MFNAADTVPAVPERFGPFGMSAIQANEFGFEMLAKHAVHGRLYRRYEKRPKLDGNQSAISY